MKEFDIKEGSIEYANLDRLIDKHYQEKILKLKDHFNYDKNKDREDYFLLYEAMHREIETNKAFKIIYEKNYTDLWSKIHTLKNGLEKKIEVLAEKAKHLQPLESKISRSLSSRGKRSSSRSLNRLRTSQNRSISSDLEAVSN